MPSITVVVCYGNRVCFLAVTVDAQIGGPRRNTARIPDNLLQVANRRLILTAAK